MDKHITSDIYKWNLNNKRVFLRVDLNVPLAHDKIVDDYRMRAIIPTLNMLLEKKSTIILATHLGRPKNQEPYLSTRILMPWFKEQGYNIIFESDLHKAQQKSYELKNSIILLENLRFYPGEKSHEQKFVHQLKELADFYVNDAFALLHRSDASVTLLPRLFEQNKRTIGPLIEHELKILSGIKYQAAHPYVLIIGGGKVHDKLPYLSHFLDVVDTILLCPAIVFTFLKALGHEVGTSLVDHAALEHAQTFLHKAYEKNVRIVFPVDYLVGKESMDGPLSYCSAEQFPADAFGISIGPKTVDLFAHEIKNAETIFLNAAMGVLRRPETIDPLKLLLYKLIDSPAYTVVGGGDSVAVVKKFHLEYGINYVTTGGGAVLAYLSNVPLPGLKELYS